MYSSSPFILYLSIVIYVYLYSIPIPNITPHKISEACLEWCSFICVVFELVGCVLGFEVVLTLGVIFYYYILYYTLLPLYSSSPSSPISPPLLPVILLIHSILVDTYLGLLIFYSSHSFNSQHSPIISFIQYLSILIYVYLYLIISFIQFLSSQSSHSFYTCRYLYILYLYSIVINKLTPHVLSEACLEWCSFICVVFELVWCVIDVLSWCGLGVIFCY